MLQLALLGRKASSSTTFSRCSSRAVRPRSFRNNSTQNKNSNSDNNNYNENKSNNDYNSKNCCSKAGSLGSAQQTQARSCDRTCTTPRTLSAVVPQISQTLRSLRVSSRQASDLGSQPSEIPAPPGFARKQQLPASPSSQWTRPHRPQYRPEDYADRSPDVDRQTSNRRRLFQHALQQSSRKAAPANLEQHALQRAMRKQQSSRRHALEKGLNASPEREARHGSDKHRSKGSSRSESKGHRNLPHSPATFQPPPASTRLADLRHYSYRGTAAPLDQPGRGTLDWPWEAAPAHEQHWTQLDLSALRAQLRSEQSAAVAQPKEGPLAGHKTWRALEHDQGSGELPSGMTGRVDDRGSKRHWAGQETQPRDGGKWSPSRIPRPPVISPELEAMVAKHAPKELHLLQPHPRQLPRRGPTLSDLLDDSGSSLEAGSLLGEEQATPAVSKPAELDPFRGGGGTAATAAGEQPLRERSCRSDAAGSNTELDQELHVPLQHLSEAAEAEGSAEGAAVLGVEAGLQPAVGTAVESAREPRTEANLRQAAALPGDLSVWDDSLVPSPEPLSQPVSKRQLERITGLAKSAQQAQHEAVRWSAEVVRLAQQPWHKAQPPPLLTSADQPGEAAKPGKGAGRRKARRTGSEGELRGWDRAGSLHGSVSDGSRLSDTSGGAPASEADVDSRQQRRRSSGSSMASGLRRTSLYEKPWRENMRAKARDQASLDSSEAQEASPDATTAYKASSPDQHTKVLEFMARKRAEIAERLQRESEAVRAPVLRRMEARRAAASVEQEQARAAREGRNKEASTRDELPSTLPALDGAPVNPSKAAGLDEAQEGSRSVELKFGGDEVPVTDQQAAAEGATAGGAGNAGKLLQAAKLMQSAVGKRKLPSSLPSSLKQPRDPVATSPPRVPSLRLRLGEEVLSPGWKDSSSGVVAEKPRRSVSPGETQGPQRKLREELSFGRDVSMRIPPLRLGSGELSLPGMPEIPVQHTPRAGSSPASGTPHQQTPGRQLGRSPRNRLWRVDPREQHQARVSAMMSQVLDLQDRIAALAVTAPVVRSPRASLPGVPTTAAQALQRDLRIPRLMMTRSLPSSIEAALAQLDLSSRRTHRPTPRRTSNVSLAILPEPQHEALHDTEGQPGSAELTAKQQPMQTAANETPRDLPGQVLSHQISFSPGMFDLGGFTARDSEPLTARSTPAVARTVPHKEQASDMEEAMAVAKQQGGLTPRPGDQAAAAQRSALVQPLGKGVTAAQQSGEQAEEEAESGPLSHQISISPGNYSLAALTARDPVQEETPRRWLPSLGEGAAGLEQSPQPSQQKLTFNVSEDAGEEMPGDGTGAFESDAGEGNGGQSPNARTSLAAELIELLDEEDETPAAAVFRASELPGRAAWDQQQRPAQEAASSEGSGIEKADSGQEHETLRKWIPMPQLQLPGPDSSLWDAAAALREENGLHRTMSASKRKLRPSEDSQGSPTPAESPIKLSNPLWELTLWSDWPPRTALEAAHCAKQPRLEGHFAEDQAVSPGTEPSAGAAEKLDLSTLTAGTKGPPESGAFSVEHTQLAADDGALQLADAAEQAAAGEGHSMEAAAPAVAVAHTAQQEVQVVEHQNGAAGIGDGDQQGAAADLEAGPHVMDSVAMSNSVEDVHADEQEQIASSASAASAEPVSGTPIKLEDILADATKPDMQSQYDDGSSKLGGTAGSLSGQSPQQLMEASASSSSAITTEWPAADKYAAQQLSELPGLDEDSAVPSAEPMKQLKAESTSSEAAEVQPFNDEEQIQELAGLQHPQPGQFREGSVQLEADVDPEPHAAIDITPRGRSSGLEHPANEPGSVDQSPAAEASTAITPAIQLQGVTGRSPASGDAVGHAVPAIGGATHPTEPAPDALRTMDTLLYKGTEKPADPGGAVDAGASVASSRANREEMDVEGQQVPLLKLPRSSSAARDDNMELGDQAEWDSSDAMSADLASSSAAMSDTPAADSPTLPPLVMDAADQLADQLFAKVLNDAITGALSASASEWDLPTQEPAANGAADRVSVAAAERPVNDRAALPDLLSSELCEWRVGEVDTNKSDRSLHAGVNAAAVEEVSGDPAVLAAGALPLDLPHGTNAMDSAEPAEPEVQMPPLVRTDAAYVAAYVDSVLEVYIAKAEWACRPGQEPLSNPQAPLDECLEEYIAMERAGPEVDDAQHIHNKALFDAVNQALKMLLPPHGPQLTTAQRRVRRERPGSHRWQAAVREEAAKQVCAWAAPRQEDDLDALLLQDILKDEIEWANTTAYEAQLLEEATDDMWSDLLSDALAAMKALPED